MFNCARWWFAGCSMVLLRRYRIERAWIANPMRICIARVFVDAPLDFRTEMPQQALHRPGSTVAERANGVTLDLLCDLHQHIDLALLCAAFRHARQHTPHPAHAFAARCALTAAFVLVEI